MRNLWARVEAATFTTTPCRFWGVLLAALVLLWFAWAMGWW